MNKFLVLLALFSLAACIKVADFGKYWDKAILDPDFGGRWHQIAGGTRPDTDTRCRIRGVAGAYEITCTDQDHKSGKRYYPVKTMVLGPYYLLALKSKDDGGEIIRYDVADNMMTVYSLNAAAAAAWIYKTHPAAQISKVHVLDSGNSSYLSIQEFDDATAKAIADIPDNDKYWRVTARFEKPKK